MARLESFERQVVLATAGLSSGAIAPALASLARSELSKAIQSGEGSGTFERFVNGRLGADESSVVPPGPILYNFVWWQNIVQFALQFCVERSPKKSGRYRQSWYVLADGKSIPNPRNIPRGAMIHIVNTQPYARKIDVGHSKMSVPHGIIEDARRAVMGIWGNMIEARGTMIQLPGGPAPAPYTLKGKFTKGIRKFARTRLRADTQKGAVMVYPSLRLLMRTG